LENGGTVPCSRRRADRDSNEDSFFDPYTLSHANSLQNSDTHAHTNNNQNIYSHHNSDAFYTNLCYYSIITSC
jgi:hypothetical protein